MPNDQHKDNKKNSSPEMSRRDFFKVSSVSLSVAIAAEQQIAIAQTQKEENPVLGPGKVNISLDVNAKAYPLTLEPRVTLLEALRDKIDLTGTKKVCDRGTCGACTVMMDGKVVYSCSILAIEAQNKKITTIEGVMQNGQLHPLQQAFIDCDGLQCGFCTPGFVMAAKGLLDKTASPEYKDLQLGLGGNLCRCGTYVGIKAAIAQMAKKG